MVPRTGIDSRCAWRIATFWGLALRLLYDFSPTVFVVGYIPSVPRLLCRIIRGWLRLSDGERVD